MSTEHQRYSLESQAAAIAEYASVHGHEIVGTYADSGKSGLSLKGRLALQRLLSDALNPDRSFDTILVLDVSRWGRFQDPDQAAHYEFICRQAGLQIIYCAEVFENNNSVATAILKHLKRVMAAEYSRELSTKLSRAHVQQARLGYRQGGSVPYGFRRLLIDNRGVPRCVLQAGQTKVLSTDRVVVVAGPPQEQAAIRQVFHWYVGQQLSALEIARNLRVNGLDGTQGKPWTANMVRSILGNELCLGAYVYNRTTSKLQSRKALNPAHLWVKVPAMAPVISEALFRRAQVRRARGNRLADERMLRSLSRLLKQTGHLSGEVMKRSNSVPSASTFRLHFGGLSKAYELIGYRQRSGGGPNGKPWTDENIFERLLALHSRWGFVSLKTIQEDHSLPSPRYLSRRFGSLKEAYAQAGLPEISESERIKAGVERRRAREQCPPNLRRFSTEALIAGLRRLRKQHGYLTASLISSDPELPSPAGVAHRFGSLISAYKLAGWSRPRAPACSSRRAIKAQQCHALR